MSLILYASAAITAILHIAIFVGIAVRVIMLRPAPGVALAWLLLVAVLPLLGLPLYLLFGERRIGQKRAQRMAIQRADFEELGKEFVKEHMTTIDWSTHPPANQMMDRLGKNKRGIPTLSGNELKLYSDTQEILAAIAADVDRAESSVQMAFYIWHEGGTADEVLEAVIRAARRGVRCRLLIDHLGARPWWRGKQPERLQEAGVELRNALPVGLLKGFVTRNDLRLHRKIVTIDGRIGWTGSMNLVDPRFFKQDAGVGEWIDAMVRVEGNAVLVLGATLVADWQRETGEDTRRLIESADLHRVRSVGEADVQVIPSGPGESSDALLQMLLGLINGARQELILTTPYFVPDDAMLRALRGAAGRGAEVHLIVPARVDSTLVRYASRSYYDDLMDAGVRIRPFRGGLLHTKSITVDGEASMIGTANLDMRSLWLNYEISTFVYDASFTQRLRALQSAYLKDCDTIDRQAWMSRRFAPRFVENAFRLVSPLL
jgi:cardiolipin synthase